MRKNNISFEVRCEVVINGIKFLLADTEELIYGRKNNACVRYVKCDGELVALIITNLMSFCNLEIEELSDAKKAILLHEVGHIVNGDIQIKEMYDVDSMNFFEKVKLARKILKYAIKKRDVNKEIKADLYSIQYVGKDIMINLLQNKLDTDISNKNEAEKRLLAVKNAVIEVKELVITDYSKIKCFIDN